MRASLDAAGVEHIGLGGVRPNPEIGLAREGVELARANDADIILPVGGGSVMDCGKAVAMMATNPGDFWDYVPQGTGGRKRIEIAPLPIVAISTTAGTGSEVDAGGVLTNPETREKVGIGHPGCFPKLAIVDPELLSLIHI